MQSDVSSIHGPLWERRLRRRPHDRSRRDEFLRWWISVGRPPAIRTRLLWLLGPIWLSEPEDGHLSDFVLAGTGLEIWAEEFEPPRWWTDRNRVKQAPGFLADRDSGLPLRLRRQADGSPVALVPALGGNPFYIDIHPFTFRTCFEAGIEMSKEIPGELLLKKWPAFHISSSSAWDLTRWGGGQIPGRRVWWTAVLGRKLGPAPGGKPPALLTTSRSTPGELLGFNSERGTIEETALGLRDVVLPVHEQGQGELTKRWQPRSWVDNARWDTPAAPIPGGPPALQGRLRLAYPLVQWLTPKKPTRNVQPAPYQRIPGSTLLRVDIRPAPPPRPSQGLLARTMRRLFSKARSRPWLRPMREEDSGVRPALPIPRRIDMRSLMEDVQCSPDPTDPFRPPRSPPPPYWNETALRPDLDPDVPQTAPGQAGFLAALAHEHASTPLDATPAEALTGCLYRTLQLRKIGSSPARLPRLSADQPNPPEAPQAGLGHCQDRLAALEARPPAPPKMRSVLAQLGCELEELSPQGGDPQLLRRLADRLPSLACPEAAPRVGLLRARAARRRGLPASALGFLEGQAAEMSSEERRRYDLCAARSLRDLGRYSEACKRLNLSDSEEDVRHGETLFLHATLQLSLGEGATATECLPRLSHLDALRIGDTQVLGALDFALYAWTLASLDRPAEAWDKARRATWLASAWFARDTKRPLLRSERPRRLRCLLGPVPEDPETLKMVLRYLLQSITNPARTEVAPDHVLLEVRRRAEDLIRAAKIAPPPPRPESRNASADFWFSDAAFRWKHLLGKNLAWDDDSHCAGNQS